MNDNAVNDATKWPVKLDNEVTPYDAVFAAAAPTATTSASAIAHFLSSGLNWTLSYFWKGT